MRRMRRALLGLYTYIEFFLAALAFVPILGLVALLHRRDPACRIRGRWMRRFGRFTSRLTPLWRFSVRGDPPAGIREGHAYVVVANHESTADPFLLSWLPWDMRWVAKEELFRLPLLGFLMRSGGDIPLRRGARSSVADMLGACRETLARGVPVMMFPEGTRSPDGRLLPFKDGAFQLAIDAGVPVLPVAIVGTRDCRPKGSVWFGDARAIAHVLAPIPTEGLGSADVVLLREQARAAIAEATAALRAELGGAPAPEALRRDALGASGR